MRAHLLAPVALTLACAATAPDTRATTNAPRECERASDCMLMPRGCGHCGGVTPTDVQAVPTGTDPPEAVCPRCRGADDPRLVAICTRDGTCAVLDLTTSALARCDTDADCTTRPRSCCACRFDPVAINTRSDAAYVALVCGAPAACPACEEGEEAEQWPARCAEHQCVWALGM